MPEIHVRGHVVGKGRPRFVRNGNGVGVYTPDATVEAERAIAGAWIVLNVQQVRRPTPISLNIEARISRPKVHYRANGQLKPNAPAFPSTRPDLDNLLKTVKDALNGVAWEDDSQVVWVQATKVYGPPGWKIHVEDVPVQTATETI